MFKKIYKKIIKAAGLALLGMTLLLILLLASGIGVFYYNYNLSPPAKLKNQIKEGQSYQEVSDLFSKYQKKYRNDPDVSITEGTTEDFDNRRLNISGGKYLHLYHWIFMDDLQLTVYFDKSERVVHIDYVGD